MKPSLSLKTLFRSPARTMLTFILLGVVSFAFFTRVAEYAVTRREINNAALQYRGIGAAEATPPEVPELPNFPLWLDTRTSAIGPHYIKADSRVSQSYPDKERGFYLNTVRYQPLTARQIGAILDLPSVTFSDTRYMTAGVSDDYYRMYEAPPYYDYSAVCIVEAMLVDKAIWESELVPPDGSPIDFFFNSQNRLFLENCKVMAGNSQYAAVQDSYDVWAKYYKPDAPYYVAFDANNSIRKLITYYTDSYTYDYEYVETLELGQRYVFVLRFDTWWDDDNVKIRQSFIDDHREYKIKDIVPAFHLSDTLTDSWCRAVWPIEGEADNYLDLEEYAPLRELIEIVNSDMRTFDVVYTEDMNSILRFAETNMGIAEGRALTREDTAMDAKVCVISRELALEYNLVVGDTMTLRLGTELFEQFKNLGAIAGTRERYSPAEIPVTLEIVGIYADADGKEHQLNSPNWSYSINTVFVPKSLLPIDEAQLSSHEFSPAEFSFVIDNAWDIPAFLEEAEPLFEQLGLRLIFNDGGWSAIADEFHAAERLSLISIAVFSAAIVLAIGFTVYLFIGRKKKEYAIMRALGTPKKQSARALILPLMSVATVSILTGSGVAWMRAVRTIRQSNALLALQDFAVNTSIPAGVVIGCILGELLLTLIIALVMLRRLGAASPLALLQGGAVRVAKKVSTVEDAALSVPLPHAASPVYATPPNDELIQKARKNRSAGFVLRYIWRHARRSALKSALALLLATLLLCAISQLVLMRQSYTDVFNNTVITARIVGSPRLTAAARIAQSEYSVNPYYESVGAVDINSANTRLVFTCDISRYTDEEVGITYAPGYDETCMDKLGEVLIVGKSLLEAGGLKLGDKVDVTPGGLLSKIVSSYMSGSVVPLAEEEILKQHGDRIMQEVRANTIEFTIVGVMSTPSGRFDNTAFSPGIRLMKQIGMPEAVDMAEYTVADNNFIEEFRTTCEEVLEYSSCILIMDTAKIENVKNTLRLLDALYPMTIAAALLIGAFLCSLIILQSSKEAAIMRVLGTTKRKTRTLLSLEQIFLSITGLAIGVCVMLMLRRQEVSRVSQDLAVFAAMYTAIIVASGIICSSLATRRSALELLQTKE